MTTDDTMSASITMDNIAVDFGQKQALKGISLQAFPGQVLGYIGPNGAGKSTTIKILNGMLDSFEGTATVCGVNVRQDPLAVKRLTGYVPEVAALYESLSPKDYLEFVGRIYGMSPADIHSRIHALLDLFDLSNETDQPMQYFSKGMKQRVLLIAGMMHNPKVLFLDEPLSGLDTNSVVLVKEIIAQYAQAGNTVFYCSHMMDVVEKICDRIVIIDKGQVVADGSFAQLQQIEKSASLESIFSQLTNQNDAQAVAKSFVSHIHPSRASNEAVAQ